MNTIQEVQAALGLTPDGDAGPKTWAAIHAKVCLPSSPVVVAPGSPPLADPRSEKCIVTLLPEVQPFARALILKAVEAGITVKILSGTRTYVEQDALYAKGRTAPGSVVTKARGGYSNHNFGIAFDIGVFEGTSYLTDSPKYAQVGAIAESLGLEWGGRWKSMPDMPHYQLRPHWAKGAAESAMLNELRSRATTRAAVFTED